MPVIDHILHAFYNSGPELDPPSSHPSVDEESIHDTINSLWDKVPDESDPGKVVEVVEVVDLTGETGEDSEEDSEEDIVDLSRLTTSEIFDYTVERLCGIPHDDPSFKRPLMTDNAEVPYPVENTHKRRRTYSEEEVVCTGKLREEPEEVTDIDPFVNDSPDRDE